MGFRMFGAAEVLSVHTGEHQAATHVRKQAHRAVFAYEPQDGMVYVRSRAISSRCNDNFDYFGAEEIEKAYQTFKGKPVFVNHHNSNHHQSRGVIIDAALHRDRNPDGSPDTWVEVLMEVDGRTYPKLAQALINGDIDRTSMGCDVQISKCSVCGNEARNPFEYCRHIPGMKGKRVFQLQPDGRKVGKLVYEECYGLAFFENSLLVEPPADPTAFFLGQVEVGPGLGHLAKAARLREAEIEPDRLPAFTPPATAPLRRTASLTPIPQEMTMVNPVDAMTVARQALAAAIAEAARAPKAPAEPPAKKPTKAEAFFHENQPDPQNLVHMFKQATPSQHAEGMDWYQHMHRTARMITGGHVDHDKGEVVGGHPALGAGLLANYSQQSGLSDNHWKASKTVLAKKGLWAGNNPGMFASQEQAHKADRMLSGEHHSTVLGQPKTRNFAHLIEHGGDDGSGKTAVCVDRHALSAAIGRRVTDEDFASANLSSSPSAAEKKAGHTENSRYRMVADAYRHAASQLSEETGKSIAPHHVQAVTWVVQRDQNDEAERHETDPNRQKLIKGRITKNKNETARWHAHVAEHFPGFADQEHWKMSALQPEVQILRHVSSLVSQAYNETKAPQDVDTLRDESCSICGNDVAYDGRECQVCGYIAPPKGLDDPDVDKAKQLDQLKQNIDDQMNASGADPSRPGADFDAGDPADLEPGGDNSANPWLECSNCQTGMRPAAPQTTGEQPPGVAAPAGPAAGDACPVCQEGQLMPAGETEDDTDAEAEAEAEEDPAQDEAQETDQEVPGDDEDDDEDDPKKKSGKNPAGRATAAMKYRDHSKEFPMNNALHAMAKQQEAAEAQQVLIDHQQRTIASLHQRMASKDSQIQRLVAGLTVIARHLGVEVETMVRSAMLNKTADEQNPAQPIPEPAAQSPSQTTVDAKTPEAFADVRAPGMVPGSNNDVAADAVTTAYTPGQDIGTPPVRQLVDVTAPIDGTQGPRPIDETKTNVDVRAGNGMNPQVAYPLNGDFANAQRTSGLQGSSEANELRTMASIRLARLQIQSNIAQGDDLTVGQRIASDPAYSMERITNEINMLNQVRTAAAQPQQTMPPRGAVPRSAGAPVQRIVPPLGSQGGGFQSTASTVKQEDDELAAALI